MIDAAFYEAVTGQEAPDDLADRIDRVLLLAGAALGKTLTEAEHTELVRVYEDGWGYVRNRPVSDAGEYDFEPHRIFVGRPGRHRVTYTAGWTEETVPDDVRTAIALGVAQLVANDKAAAEGGLEVGADVQSYRVGDVSVTRIGADPDSVLAADGGSIPKEAKAMRALGSEAVEIFWRYRRVI